MGKEGERWGKVENNGQRMRKREKGKERWTKVKKRGEHIRKVAKVEKKQGGEKVDKM